MFALWSKLPAFRASSSQDLCSLWHKKGRVLRARIFILLSRCGFKVKMRNGCIICGESPHKDSSTRVCECIFKTKQGQKHSLSCFVFRWFSVTFLFLKTRLHAWWNDSGRLQYSRKIFRIQFLLRQRCKEAKKKKSKQTNKKKTGDSSAICNWAMTWTF